MRNEYRPTPAEAAELAKQEGIRRIPIATELFGDVRTPIETLRILQKKSDHCYILESMEDSATWGRYTILGYDPLLEFSCKDGRIRIVSRGKVTEKAGDPRVCLREIIQSVRSPRLPDMPPFTGGLVGYFAYDYIKYSEPKLKLQAADPEDFRDADLMLFDRVIAFDRLKQKIILVANADAQNLDLSYTQAVKELEQMRELILNGTPLEYQPAVMKTPFRAAFSKDQYCAMVNEAKRHITEGDIFQVVLSNGLEAQVDGSIFDIYRVLRTTNPSPYMFYFSGCDVEIAGASPETLVKVQGRTVKTFPLAGTRPRGKDKTEDARLETELLTDPKELAEHNMLVDLGRNDLGKIAAFGTVKVVKYHVIEKFSYVMHIGSEVQATMAPGKDALDALSGVLPAGTLSGAPKFRACQLIDSLENSRRGLYGGAIGYLSADGDLDTCIAIRIAFKKNGKVFVRSGAGIVADSVPEKEYQECLNKAKAVLQATELADGGLE
ncbi:MAG: anthranilate synthase component I family protein [Methanomethylophilus sp.]